ncbi:MAG: MFS transporter [Propionibacteriaceae bacterium]
MTRAQRLDRLPFTRAHRRLLLGAGLGWALDAMDVGLISFVMATLAKQWKLTGTELSWVGSIGFVGMALGASIGGLLADRIGRRQVFALTLLVYGLATGASAFATGLGMLIALRFVVGLGLGAELPVASTLVSEYAPRHIRGRMVVALEAFWAVGWLMAALIGYLFIPTSPRGWRYSLAVGLIPMLYAVIVRFGLPESVRFLESKDRDGEAEKAVRVYESAAGLDAVATLESTPAPTTKESLWARQYRGRTLALWLVWFFVNFSYYGAFIWLPTLLAARFGGLTKSFEFTLIITIAQLPGYAVAAWLIEKWGRRSTLATFLFGSAVAAALFGFAATGTQVVAAGCLLSFFNLGAWGALYAIGPEIYPTHIRATGSGAAAAFGRIASILAPLSVPVFMGWGRHLSSDAKAGGMIVTFSIFALAFVAAASAALFLPERKDVTLED